MFNVVIPVAGQGTLLQAAVHSATAPLVDRIFVIADDAEALTAARTCAETCNRVTVLETPGAQRQGAGAARNLGVSAALNGTPAPGTWLAFLDADDTFAPGYFEALAELLEQPEAAGVTVVHTRLVSVTGQGAEAVVEEKHPLRFRFEAGSRFVSLTDEPHMIGTSVAAAVFEAAAVQRSGVRFAEGCNWSEDSDFMVRFLLATGAQRVGVCAGARYLYRVQQGGSLTESAWVQPGKYLVPFERFYLPWTRSSEVLPVWLQNQLLYELSMYVQVDRQVFSPAFGVPAEVLERCTGYVQEVLGHLDSEVVEGFALVPFGLDRRQMFLAQTRGAPGLPLYPVTSRQVFTYAQRPWRGVQKFTYFFAAGGVTGQDVPAEVFELDGRQVVPRASKWVSHTLFGVEFVRERILWFEGAPLFRLAGDQVPAAPYAGAPQLPAPAVPRAEVALATPAPPVAVPLMLRVKRRLWHLKQRWATAKRPAAPAVKPVWLYADRTHRAGDNAEAFYRFARTRLPGVRHVFLLAEGSPDWQRLQGEGFDLLAAGSEQAQRVFAAAHTLLLSDISDSTVVALLTGLRASQRLVFLQHGIVRREHWRWLNPRRIDVMLTSDEAEYRAIVADGSSYTLTGVEVALTGLPRHDALLELVAAEQRRDYVVLAPTWSRELQGASADALLAWVEGWVRPLAGLGSGLEPVFFVHPNMERSLEQLGVELPVKAVYGAGLPAALARAVAVVSDVSSVADEGLVAGVPAVLVLDVASPSAQRAAGLWQQPGVEVVAPGDGAALVDAVLTAQAQGRRTPAVAPGAAERVLELLEGCPQKD